MVDARRIRIGARVFLQGFWVVKECRQWCRGTPRRSRGGGYVERFSRPSLANHALFFNGYLRGYGVRNGVGRWRIGERNSGRRCDRRQGERCNISGPRGRRRRGSSSPAQPRCSFRLREAFRLHTLLLNTALPYPTLHLHAPVTSFRFRPCRCPLFFPFAPFLTGASQ